VTPGIELHFRHEHQLKGKVLKDIKDYYGSIELADPKFAELPEDGSVAVELLDIFSGYSCAACKYYTVARDNTVRHLERSGSWDGRDPMDRGSITDVDGWKARALLCCPGSQ
jgi:hypothetical protein